jgi:hypothetical protein
MTTSRLTCARIIEAIPGSRGIKTVIAARVPCVRATLDKYIRQHPSVRAAFEAECNAMLDVAHSVVAGNIEAAAKAQENEPGKQVDSTDAKWFLARKGRDQGFGTDPAVQVVQQAVTVADFRALADKRLAEVDELEE